jgi:hypothetical protein
MCVAVGYGITEGNGHGLLVADKFWSGTWTSAKLPTTDEEPYGPSPGQMVSCPAVGSCVAVGTENQQGGPIPADVLSDSKWQAITLPTPSNATFAGMESISCPTTTWCVAVGFMTDTAYNNAILVDTLSDGTWTSAEVGIGDATRMFAVSCDEVGSCVAVGRDGNAPPYGSAPVIASLTDGSWTVTQPAIGKNSGQLSGVSCSTAGTCVAVGTLYAGQAGNELPLAGTFNDGVWNRLKVAAPPNADQSGLLSASCPPSSACVAVGYDYSPANGSLPIAVNLRS